MHICRVVHYDFSPSRINTHTIMYAKSHWNKYANYHIISTVLLSASVIVHLPCVWIETYCVFVVKGWLLWSFELNMIHQTYLCFLIQPSKEIFEFSVCFRVVESNTRPKQINADRTMQYDGDDERRVVKNVDKKITCLCYDVIAL